MSKDAFCMRLIMVLFIACSITSCAKRSYIFETRQVTNSITKDTKDFFVFENDTMKVVYSFWSKGGSMAFSIYNKLESPDIHQLEKKFIGFKFSKN